MILAKLRSAISDLAKALEDGYDPDILPVKFLDQLARLRAFMLYRPVSLLFKEKAQGFIQVEHTLFDMLATTIEIDYLGYTETAEFIRELIFPIIPLLRSFENEEGCKSDFEMRDYDYRGA